MKPGHKGAKGEDALPDSAAFLFEITAGHVEYVQLGAGGAISSAAGARDAELLAER